MKKPQFNGSEMHGDLPYKKGTVVHQSAAVGRYISTQNKRR